MVAVAFMLLFISIFDLARFVIVQQSVVTVLAETGRRCQVTPPETCAALDQTTLSGLAPLLDPSQFIPPTIVQGLRANPDPNFQGGYQPGVNISQVTIGYPYQAMSPWLSSLDGTISMTATYFY